MPNHFCHYLLKRFIYPTCSSLHIILYLWMRHLCHDSWEPLTGGANQSVKRILLIRWALCIWCVLLRTLHLLLDGWPTSSMKCELVIFAGQGMYQYSWVENIVGLDLHVCIWHAQLSSSKNFRCSMTRMQQGTFFFFYIRRRI